MSSARRRAQPIGRFIFAFVVALVLLSAIGLDYRDDPFIERQVSDANSYEQWAQRIATNGFSAEPTFHQSPLFPLLLSTVYDATGEAPRRSQLLLQALLLALAIALLVPLGDQLFGGSVAGPAAALVALLYAPFAFHALKLLPVALALATQALALLLLLRARASGRIPAAALAGLALGIACIARAEMLLFIPLALLALAAPGAARVARLAAFAGGLFIAIAPISAHNMQQGDRILIASASGENLFIGNLRGGDGGHQPLHPKAGDLFSQRVLARKLAEESAGEPLSSAAVSSYWRSRALQEIGADPLDWLRLEGRKLQRILDPGDPTDLYSLALERTHYLPSLWLLGLSTSALWLLGAIGFVLLERKRRRAIWPLFALLALHLTVLMSFFVSTRLRLPLLFWLCPLAGFALACAANRWRERRAATVPVTAGLLLVLCVGGALLAQPGEREIGRLASVLSSMDRLDESIALLEPLLGGEAPEGTLLDQAAWVYSKRGDLARALTLYDRAIEAGVPTSRRAGVWTRKANLLERMERIDAATAAHDAAIAAGPEEAGAWYERALFRLRRGAVAPAISDLERAATLQPDWPAPREALRRLRAARR